MSGIDYLADTNAIIYLLDGNECMRPFLRNRLAVSVISVMELLSYQNISEEEEVRIRRFLKGCMIVDISEEIREQTIRIRRSKKIKLPDAIIAATAIKCGVPLLTADTGLFNNIEEISIKKLSP